MLVLQNVLGDYTAIKAQDVQIVDTLGSFQTLSFSFVATPENEVAAKMMIPMTVIEVPENKQKYRLLTANSAKVGSYLQYSVTAVHIAKDMHRYYRESRLPQTQSLKACLDFMFQGTPFNYVITGDFANFYFSEGFGENFVDELLTQCANDFKFEYYFDNYILHIAKRIGKDESFVYVDNVNCAKIAVSENYESIATHIIGYSNPKQSDGESSSTETTYEQRIDYTSPIVESANWPVIDATPVKYDQTLDRETLLARMKASLQDYPQVQYTIDSVNFKKFTRIKNDIAIGNQGWLRDRFGIDVKTRISALTWYPQDLSKTDAITFGNVMLDPVTWSIRNKRAFEQNFKLGRKLQQDIRKQQGLYEKTLKNQNAMSGDLAEQAKVISRLQNQLKDIEDAGNYWVSERQFIELSQSVGDLDLSWYSTLQDKEIHGAMINLTSGNTDLNELFNSQRINIVKSGSKFIGVVHELRAKTTADAVTEANWALEQLRKNDVNVNVIVACKISNDSLPQEKRTLTAIVQAFNKTLSDAGYKNTCDFSAFDWFNDRFTSSARYRWVIYEGEEKPANADAWQFKKNFDNKNISCNKSYNSIFV